MSNQKPSYPAHMYPFMNHYMPPTYLNPFMHNQLKNPPMPLVFDQMPPPPYAYSPYCYPPYPMMYPPPPQPVFQQPDIKPPFSQPQQLPQPKSSRDSLTLNVEQKKTTTEKPQLQQPSPIEIIVLSDNDSNPKQNKPQKRLPQKQLKSSTPLRNNIDPALELKLKRAIRKATVPAKAPVLPPKTQNKEKKKEAKLQQLKEIKQKDDYPEPKNIQHSPNEIYQQTQIRNTRIKFLTAKDGRGKILIGEEYQADLPEFITQDETYSVWTDSMKKALLSRMK